MVFFKYPDYVQELPRSPSKLVLLITEKKKLGYSSSIGRIKNNFEIL